MTQLKKSSVYCLNWSSPFRLINFCLKFHSKFYGTKIDWKNCNCRNWPSQYSIYLLYGSIANSVNLKERGSPHCSLREYFFSGDIKRCDHQNIIRLLSLPHQIRLDMKTWNISIGVNWEFFCKFILLQTYGTQI